MWAWLSNLIGAKDVVKETLSGVGNLAKDIKTIATGKLDPEKLNELLLKVGELESKIASAQSSIIVTEAQGNFLQRSWRPISMLTFLVLIIFNQFGMLVVPLSSEIWGLFKIGLGGYIGSRGVEKIVKTLKG
jgi:hypothetical protein